MRKYIALIFGGLVIGGQVAYASVDAGMTYWAIAENGPPQDRVWGACHEYRNSSGTVYNGVCWHFDQECNIWPAMNSRTWDSVLGAWRFFGAATAGNYMSKPSSPPPITYPAQSTVLVERGVMFFHEIGTLSGNMPGLTGQFSFTGASADGDILYGADAIYDWGSPQIFWGASSNDVDIRQISLSEFNSALALATSNSAQGYAIGNTWAPYYIPRQFRAYNKCVGFPWTSF